MNSQSVAHSFTPSIRQLKAFASVYQLRKFSAAAEQLNITQSAVSVLIRELEQGLGMSLFERSTRSMRPTQAAHDMSEVADRILRDVSSLSQHARELSELKRGRVRLAITPTLGEILLPPVLRQFRQNYPGIQIFIDDCSPDQFVARVVSEQVDFGIGSPEQARADVEELVLMHDDLVAVCPREHPLASRPKLRWKDLAGHDIITVKPGYGIRPLIDASAAQGGVRLQVLNEVSFLSTALWMSRAGLALSIMPSCYAQNSQAHNLVTHTLHEPRVSRPISLVSKKGRALSPAAQTLATALQLALSPESFKQKLALPVN